MKGRERRDVCVCCVCLCVCLKANSRVIQQQHNGVKFFSGSVISSEWHDEVIEPVPRRLCRHDDELVFETIRLGILKAVVPATLHRKGREEREKKGFFFWCVFIK